MKDESESVNLSSKGNPAPVSLASTIYESIAAAHVNKTKSPYLDALADPEASRSRERLCFGLRGIDEDVLRGGIDYGFGGLCCLSGPKDMTVELAMHAMATHLLSGSQNRVFYIDTNKQLLFTRLRGILIERARSASAFSGDPPGHENVDERVKSCLDRISIHRALDFTGVMEAASEISTQMRSCSREQQLKKDEDLQPKLSRIADSQDDEDVEEIRFQQHFPNDTSTTHQANTAAAPASSSEEHTANLIVVSHLTSLLGSLMRGNQTQGHELLVHFMRSLRDSIDVHGAAALLLNDSVAPGEKLVGGGLPTAPQHKAKGDMDRAGHLTSAFGSVAYRPALGKTLAHLVDMSLLVSKLARVDGRVVDVVEVLADRVDGRVGLWAGFEVRGESLRDVV